ncbi:NADH-quinone oxidoreductase subunit NuoH [Miltoncostaea oceani]|uniref:NADH-quinone oxidoreductase subunit NuoH n=1 Tax=Miltoncostaea oceani TaxID=2843216 RepID=UPI001C3E744F|nr:NADH-quinone oxidoreductase subunit NuoH [Miltoncostaea oceani]
MDEAFLVVLIKAAIVVFVLITAFAYTLLWERKLLGRFQARYGPNRAGPIGYLQPLADVVKLIFKEDFVPRGANRLLFQIAPMISVFAAVAAVAVIPFGDPIEVFGHDVALVGADLNIGVLFLFALSGLGFYGLILGGWASGNKYSLLGAARTAAQLVSYEVAMGLSIIGVIMMAQSLSLVDIVNAQRDAVWYVLVQPLGFAIFLVAAVAETNRAPFDMPEAESELVAGYHTEYGGLKFAMFFLAEYINMIIISALGATLFLGGFAGPWLPGVVWLAIKIAAMLFLFIWLRATLPRLRYDRLMKLGWKVLLPLATLNLVVTAIVVALGFAN